MTAMKSMPILTEACLDPNSTFCTARVSFKILVKWSIPDPYATLHARISAMYALYLIFFLIHAIHVNTNVTTKVEGEGAGFHGVQCALEKKRKM